MKKLSDQIAHFIFEEQYDKFPFVGVQYAIAKTSEVLAAASGIPVVGLISTALSIIIYLMVFVFMVLARLVCVCICQRNPDVLWTIESLMVFSLIHLGYSFLNTLTVTFLAFYYELLQREFVPSKGIA